MSGDSISLTSDIYWNETSQSLIFSDMANSKLRRWQPAQLLSPALLSKIELNSSKPIGQREPFADNFTLDQEQVIGSGSHLCRITPCDWNQDGREDFLIAEIGTMIITDQKIGNIALYLSKEDNSYERIELANQLARPVEACLVDYDNDGDMDIVVAEFGYQHSGCLSLLRNQSPDTNSTSANQFTYEVLDPRHGYLSVQLADMNNDSKPDLVTAMGQEYESIQIRYRKEDGGWRNEIVMALPDPSYNTSSITLCDLNADGKLDFLHTCGDIFDSFVPKPFHGVRWVENLGGGRWEVHELGMLIGAMKAVAADFDLDGDLDVAGVGLFPASSKFTEGISYDSVCWWEQRADRQFVRHWVERDRCLHSSCAVADVDGDNRPDLVVGEWADGRSPASLRVFFNRRLQSPLADKNR
jgi:FG-GAP-like repeat